MKPDNRLIVRCGFLDTEYLAESSGNDAEIDRMILIYRELQTHQSVTPYHGTIAGKQDYVDQRYGKYPALTTEVTTSVTTIPR